MYPDLVLEKIKRMTTEVTPALLRKVIDEINFEHKVKMKNDKIVAEGGVPPAPGLPGSDPWADGGLPGADLVDPFIWEFVDKSRWMYTYLLSKLNAELQSKTLGVENKNGLEVYR